MRAIVSWMLSGLCVACGAPEEEADELGSASHAVLGGSVVPPGRWDEVSAHGCTGVLIAKRWVLTAGHCTAGNDSVQLKHRTENRRVVRTYAYPNWQTTLDVGLLELASDATVPPAQLAFGCGSAFVADGAALQIVGYGANGPLGSQFNVDMREATTVIIDADCSGDWSCLVPGKEFIAGSDGVDTCSGDSGGPAYVFSSVGPLVAGITSRGANPGATPLGGDAPCGTVPGLYVRTDGLVSWIQSVIGAPLPEPDCAGMGGGAGTGGASAGGASAGGAGGSAATGGAAGMGGSGGAGMSGSGGGAGMGGAGMGGSGGGAGSGAGGASAATPIIEGFSGSLTQGQTAARGPFSVQPGTSLRALLSGTGDADLYLRFGSRPTLSSYDCRPYKGNSSEECLLSVPPGASSAYIDVRAFRASTYALRVERVPGPAAAPPPPTPVPPPAPAPPPPAPPPAGQQTLTVSGRLTKGQQRQINPVPVKPQSQLVVAMTGTGDSDLYVRFAGAPALNAYDCRPYTNSSVEQCVLTVPASATQFYIMVNGYAAGSYSVNASYVSP